MTPTKCVHYCYPSSPMAIKLKARFGAWYVTTTGKSEPALVVRPADASNAESAMCRIAALDRADALPGDFDKNSMR